MSFERLFPNISIEMAEGCTYFPVLVETTRPLINNRKYPSKRTRLSKIGTKVAKYFNTTPFLWQTSY